MSEAGPPRSKAIKEDFARWGYGLVRRIRAVGPVIRLSVALMEVRGLAPKSE